MLLDLRKIIHTPGGIVPFDYEMNLNDVAFYDEHPIQEPVHVKGEVRSAGGALMLSGAATVNFHLLCDRCLKPFERRQEIPLDVLLAEELEDEENDEIVLLEDGCVDMDELVYSAVILAMDTKNLCKEDCKGLCDRCGADLNEGPCGCKPEIDPRLAALAQLLDDKTE